MHIKYLNYFLPVDLAILALITLAIFKNFSTFFKALYIHLTYDLFLEKSYKAWEKANDSNHKIFIFYWFALALFGSNILVYHFFVDPHFFTIP